MYDLRRCTETKECTEAENRRLQPSMVVERGVARRREVVRLLGEITSAYADMSNDKYRMQSISLQVQRFQCAVHLQ